MADYSKDDFVQLVKRIGAYLSGKVSKILNTQDIESVWAIAGLAVAVIITWRLLSVPQRRRQPKREAPSSSNSGDANLFPSGVYEEDSRAQTVIDEFFQPVKPTLGQIVRQRLSDGRKVTCRLLGVILEESTPEELQNQATVRSSVLDVLLEITKFCDLYLMETILDDESEKKVLVALENAGIFTSGGLVKDKVVFCLMESVKEWNGSFYWNEKSCLFCVMEWAILKECDSLQFVNLHSPFHHGMERKNGTFL